ncbi:MAG TPA: SulP family inorganic anion transporter [Polyangiales bacterium]|nr:SulP family inorganic anion transporter [Polyangiales bacterium]
MKPGLRLGKHDVSASLVVLLVALPLCMGVAIASGMPPSAGLITGIVGGLLVGAFTGSPLQVSGPAAGLTVLVWNIAEQHGVAAVGSVVLVAGLLQAAAALLGFGRLFRAISPAVVYGMLGGIGVLIVASQWHVMFDDKPVKSGLDNLLHMPGALHKALLDTPGTTHFDAALLGLLTIASIVAWNRWKPRRLALVPAPLIGVLLATLVAGLGQFPVQHVDVPDSILGAIQLPTAQGLARFVEPGLLVSAISLALIASAETLLCAGAVDRMQDKVRTDYNRELLAQGLGNAVCGALGALPMTGVIVRSSANVGAGAETRASTMLHGLWLLLVVLLLPGALRAIPTASLAAVLVHTGWKLVSPAQLRELRVFGWQSVGIYAVTLISIVATDLLTGVLLGVTLSVLRLLLRLGTFSLDVEHTGSRVRARLSGAVTFVGLPRLAALLERVPHAPELHLDVDGVAYIDHACLVAIGDFERLRERTGTRVQIAWPELEARSEKVRGGLERSAA